MNTSNRVVGVVVVVVVAIAGVHPTLAVAC